jgi:hypothetical protein
MYKYVKTVVNLEKEKHYQIMHSSIGVNYKTAWRMWKHTIDNYTINKSVVIYGRVSKFNLDTQMFLGG